MKILILIGCFLTAAGRGNFTITCEEGDCPDCKDIEGMYDCTDKIAAEEKPCERWHQARKCKDKFGCSEEYIAKRKESFQAMNKVVCSAEMKVSHIVVIFIAMSVIALANYSDAVVL